MKLLRRVRTAGLVINVLAALLLALGVGTAHMVEHDNGHYGLWRTCVNSSRLGSFSNATSPKSIPSPNTSGRGWEEMDCEDVGFLDAPALFNVTRVVLMLAAVGYALGFLSARHCCSNLSENPQLQWRFFGEINTTAGALTAWMGLWYFRENRHTASSSGYPDGELGVSYGLAQKGVYFTFPAVILMMTPRLSEHVGKNCSTPAPHDVTAAQATLCSSFSRDPLGACYRCFFAPKRREQISEFNSVSETFHVESSLDIPDTSANPATLGDHSHNPSHSATVVADGFAVSSFGMSGCDCSPTSGSQCAPSSSRHRQTGPTLGWPEVRSGIHETDPHLCLSPAYEELPPPTSPPSYDDVLREDFLMSPAIPVHTAVGLPSSPPPPYYPPTQP